MKKREDFQFSGRFSMVLRFLRGGRLLLLCAFSACVLSVLFNFLMPQTIRVTVDSVLGEVPLDLPAPLQAWVENQGGRDFLRSNLILCAAAAVLFSLLSGIFTFLSRTAMSASCEGTLRRMRDGLFSHIQRLPYAWHVGIQTGDIIQRCTSDVDVVRNFLSNQLMELFRTVVLVALAVSWMFSMSVSLTLVSLAFIPLVVGYSGLFYRGISSRFRVADEAEGDLSAAVQENLTGVRVVRAFGRETHEIEGFEKKNNLFTELWLRLGRLMGWYWSLGDLVTALQVMTVIVVGLVQAANGALTLGEFTVFVSYNSMMAWPVRNFGRILGDMSKTGVSLERLKEIFDAREEHDDPRGLTPDLSGDIVFDHVNFSYDGGEPVLKDLCFTIPEGSTFGLLGGTGSGKSTLTYLLARLYDLPEDCGSITIGGVDIRKIRLSYLRENVGLVLQEPFLFSRTIGENIRGGRPDAPEGEVRAAAKAAAVDDAIMGFTGGYDTLVGERGVTLSGGQKQRVAIARMLLQDAPIQIFDDSLSAVDTETDGKIRAALRQRAGRATTLIISHRITTLMQADCILVLERGRIAQMGSHAALVEEEGVYRRIYEIQKGVEEEESHERI